MGEDISAILLHCKNFKVIIEGERQVIVSRSKKIITATYIGSVEGFYTISISKLTKTLELLYSGCDQPAALSKSLLSPLAILRAN